MYNYIVDILNSKEEKIAVRSVKCFLTGLPRVGKTTFLERICGKPNLAKREESINISTGYNAPVPVVVCQCDKERTEVTTAIVSTCADWKVLQSNEETAAVMFKIKKCGDVTEATKHVHTVRSDSTSSIHNIQGEQNSTSVESPTVFTSPDPLPNSEVFTGHTKAIVKPTASNANINNESNAYKPLIKPKSFDKFDDYVKHVLKEQGLPSIDQLQNMSMVYFIDTGGQPEFHEILPVILRGSSIFLVFFSLEKDLYEKVQVKYQLKADHSSYQYEASCSSIEIVYQLLSSFYSANYDATKETSDALLSPLIEEGKSRFRAAIIATYADKLKYKVKDIDIDEQKKSAELRDQYLEVINEELKKALHDHSSSFSEAGFLTQLNADSKLLFFPIDNMDGTDEEIVDVKEKLTPLITNFPDHKLPRSMAIFHLVLQHYFKTTGVCSIQEAIDLGHECGIKEANVRAVLRYFHKTLGTILFYDTVNCTKEPKSQQCINGIVVCDPNILYECITNIIIVSFAGIGPDTGHAKRVRETGEIKKRFIDDVLQKRNQSKFKSHYVICLLKWFKLLHEITKNVYFMPCLLEPAKPDPIYKSYKELDTQTSIPSLLIHFKGGYVPVGVFSALVVTLADTCKLDDDERFRNSVQFWTGSFAIKLVVYFPFIEIRVPGPVEISENLHEHCLEFKCKIESSLKTLPEETGRSSFCLGYFCPGSKDEDIKLHACLRENNNTMRCSWSPKCRAQGYDIPNENKIWFDDWPGLEKVRLYIFIHHLVATCILRARVQLQAALYISAVLYIFIIETALTSSRRTSSRRTSL